MTFNKRRIINISFRLNRIVPAVKNIVLYFTIIRKLYEILKKHNIEDCITMKICSEYIDGKIEDKAYEVKDKIKIYLEKIKD
jgi:hypothetical protein